MTIQNYKIGLEKNKANFIPLTPVSFLERTASVFPNYTSVCGGFHTYLIFLGSHCSAFANVF